MGPVRCQSESPVPFLVLSAGAVQAADLVAIEVAEIT